MTSFVLFVIVFCLAVSAADAQSPPPAPLTGQILQQVAGSLQMYVDPLPNMPMLNGYSGSGNSRGPGSLTIGMYQKKWQFHRDLPPTTVFVYGTSLANATFPGPTIAAKQGTPLQVTWQNHLPQQHILPIDTTVPTAIPKNGGVPTVVHLHGGVHEPQSDGSALAWFTADFSETGPKWTKATYTYPNILHAANLWYHDHALGLTRANLLAGLIGAYNIQNDDVETPFDLPCNEYDRHLIIVDRSFNVDGSLYMNSTGNNPTIHPEWQPEYFGEAIIVNGKAWPYLTVKSRRYRFRILNASNARYLRLSLSKGLQFIVIGSDSSYLNAPVTTPSVLLAPAEISDVVIDFSQLTSNETELLNDAPYPYPTGSPAGPLNGKVMKFVLARPNPTQADNSTIPVKQVNYPLPSAADATVTRYIAMYEYLSPTGLSTHLYINGKRFEDPATESPKVGSIELWEVINLTGDNHPLHIHLGLFQRIKVQQLVNQTDFQNCMTANNDAVACNISRYATGPTMAVPEYEKTWKNVVKIEPGCVTSVIVRFNLVDQKSQYPFDPTAEPGYVYHCHILDHEDNSMIRPLKMVA